MKFKTMTDGQLKQVVKDCDAAVEADCFGSRDIVNLLGAKHELNQRGIEIECMERRKEITFRRR